MSESQTKISPHWLNISFLSLDIYKISIVWKRVAAILVRKSASIIFMAFAQSWRYKPGQYIAGASGCGPPALPYTRA